MNTQDQGPHFRILCVDDNHDVADSTALLVSAVGFDVCVCYDGPSALAAAREFLPGICLIDLNMPGMDGDELAFRLREQGLADHVLLVAVTAMATEECRKRIQTAGFHLHLVKPVDPHKLLSVVDEQFKLWVAAEHKGSVGAGG